MSRTDGCAVLWNPREGARLASLPGGGVWAVQLADATDAEGRLFA